MVYNNVKELIGNTPLLKIDKKITGLKNIDLYVKCELYNPFGSIKDRTALSLINDDINRYKENNNTLIEFSSGNTAKALQVLCSIEGIKFKAITNRMKQKEIKDILQILGIDLEELPGLSECPDPSSPNNPQSHLEKMINKDKTLINPNQYYNLKNPQAHFETGKEIYNDIGNIDYFFGTLGTTGSTRGIIEFFQSVDCEFKKIGVIGRKGENIPGIRNSEEMNEVGIFDSKLYDEILEVGSMNAIDGMLTLNRKVGLLAGPTSGAAYFRTVEYLKEIDENIEKSCKAVFVACDRVEPYISYVKDRRPDVFDSSIVLDSHRTLSEEDMNFKKVIKTCDVENFIAENNPLIIDLRGNLAYKTKYIKNSINITDFNFDELIKDGLPFPKNMKVLLICAIGNKSEVYSAYLNKKGLDIYSLEGGISKYNEEDLPLESNISKKLI